MEQRKFLDFLDMIDGGGAGRSGDKFSGGGLLSGLANAFADPYGSEDAGRMAARKEFYASRGIGEPLNTTASMAAPAAAAPQTSMMAAAPAANPMAGAPAYLQPSSMQMPYTAPPPLDPNGNYVAPPPAAAPNYTQMSSMGMPQMPQLTFQQFVDGLGPIAATASPGALKQAYVNHMSGY